MHVHVNYPYRFRLTFMIKSVVVGLSEKSVYREANEASNWERRHHRAELRFCKKRFIFMSFEFWYF